jgi:hypothetical protein
MRAVRVGIEVADPQQAARYLELAVYLEDAKHRLAMARFNVRELQEEMRDILVRESDRLDNARRVARDTREPIDADFDQSEFA